MSKSINDEFKKLPDSLKNENHVIFFMFLAVITIFVFFLIAYDNFMERRSYKYYKQLYNLLKRGFRYKSITKISEIKVYECVINDDFCVWYHYKRTTNGSIGIMNTSIPHSSTWVAVGGFSYFARKCIGKISKETQIQIKEAESGIYNRHII